MDDKVDRLRSVQIKLMEILDFLSNYLPLVNCHSNDFILNNHWDKFLTEPIRKELDSLSACDLVSLLNQTKTIEDKRPVEKLPVTKESDPSLWNLSVTISRKLQTVLTKGVIFIHLRCRQFLLIGFMKI